MSILLQLIDTCFKRSAREGPQGATQECKEIALPLVSKTRVINLLCGAADINKELLRLL